MLAHELQARLSRAAAKNEQRYLAPVAVQQSDFCSNDYLGLAQGGELMRRVLAAAGDERRFGATGSRLLSGTWAQVEELEAGIAAAHRSESALLFNSGYDANIGLYSSLPASSVRIFYDEHVHASTKDGLALANTWTQPFRHNDLAHLEGRLRKAGGPALVTVEALYSMDGAYAPLQEMAALCRRYDAQLIVDEAHSVGVSGEAGEGLVQALGLEREVYARVLTYGKAFGCHGAAIVGPRLLRDYLVNFAHSFVYSTALPTLSLLALRVAYTMVAQPAARSQLQTRIAELRRAISHHGLDSEFLPSSSQIQGLMLPGRDVVALAGRLNEQGFAVKGIRSPTVRRGSERLRLCLHSYNTPSEIERLLLAVKELR